MNRFLYYFPKSPGCNEEMLSSRGLLQRFKLAGGVTCAYSVSEARSGPDSGHGCIVARGNAPALYSAENQVWLDCERFWVGVETGFAPGRDDLVRAIGLDGDELRLLDGNAWRVPMLRKWDRSAGAFVCALPQVLRPVRVNGAARIQKAVAGQHAEIDALGELILTAFLQSQSWPLDALFEACAKLLAINYMLGTEEIGMLGLIDQAAGMEMLRRAVDIGGMERHAAELVDQGVWIPPSKTSEATGEPPPLLDDDEAVAAALGEEGES